MNEHSHTHHHHRHGKAFAIGIAINTAFVLAEIVYGISANSLALLADAGHNASDVVGLIMAWGAIQLASRKTSERFTYGLQSASIIAALGNALLLLITVGGIGYEAIQRLASPETAAAHTVMIVAAIGALVNGVTAMLFHTHDHHDMNIHGAFLHMVADAAISLGVVLSGFLILKTGWLWLDPAASLAIIIVILIGTWKLLRESVTLALHAAPQHIDLMEVKNYLGALGGVKEVHDLHIWAMSTTGVAMSAHLLMPGGHPGDAFIGHITHELEHRFHINHATLQIEIGDGTHCDIGCDHDH